MSKFLAWMKLFGSYVFDFILSFLKVLQKNGGRVLLETALYAVQEMAKTELSNAEKREEAYRKVWNMLKSSGINATENAIRTAIELAVAKIKDK